MLYAIMFLIHGRNFALRLIKFDMKIKLSNHIMMIDIYLLLASMCGMIQFTNWGGHHYKDKCTAYIAGAFVTPFIIISGNAYMASTKSQVLEYYNELTCGPGTSGKRKLKRLSLWRQFWFAMLTLTIGVVPRYVACNSNSPAKQAISHAILYMGYMIISGYVEYSSVVVFLKSSEIIKLVRSSDETKRAQGVVVNKAKVEEVLLNFSNWNTLRIRYAVFTSMGLGAIVAQFVATIQNFIVSNREGEQLREDAYSPFETSRYLFDVASLVALLLVGYFNAISSDFLIGEKEESGSRHATVPLGETLQFRSPWAKWIIAHAWVISLCGVPITAMVSLIYNNIGVELTVALMLTVNCGFIATQLIHAIDWTRNEEIESCSNYLKGRKPRIWNFLLILFECCSFIGLAFDSLFTWWCPLWIKVVGDLMFNMVSVDKLSVWGSAVGLNLPYSVTSNVVYLFLGAVYVSQIITKFVHLPRLVIRFFNAFNYLMFDVGAMPLTSFLLKRIHCESADGKTSMFTEGTMVGYEYIPCDRSYSHISSVVLGCMFFGYTYNFGIFYNGTIRNKGNKPRLMDVPAFACVRFTIKTLIATIVSLTSENLPQNPWMRSLSNCFLIILLTVTSIRMVPVMGPEGRRWNGFRSIGYGISSGFVIAAFVSLLCKSSGVDSSMPVYTILPAVSFIVFPLLGGSVVYVIWSKWRFDAFRRVEKLCRDIASKTTYEEREDLCLQESHETLFSAALLVSSHVKFTQELNSRLKRLHGLLSLSVEEICLNGNKESLMKALQCVEAASLYAVGLKDVNMTCSETVVNIILTSLGIIHSMNDTRMADQLANMAKGAQITKVLEIIIVILTTSSNILVRIVNGSKHYKTNLLKKCPALIAVVASIQNNLYYTTLKWNIKVENVTALHRNLILLLLVLKPDISDEANIKEYDGRRGSRLASENQKGGETKSQISNGQNADKLVYKLDIISLDSIVTDMVKQLVIGKALTKIIRQPGGVAKSPSNIRIGDGEEGKGGAAFMKMAQNEETIKLRKEYRAISKEVEDKGSINARQKAKLAELADNIERLGGKVPSPDDPLDDDMPKDPAVPVSTGTPNFAVKAQTKVSIDNASQQQRLDTGKSSIRDIFKFRWPGSPKGEKKKSSTPPSSKSVGSAILGVLRWSSKAPRASKVVDDPIPDEGSMASIAPTTPSSNYRQSKVRQNIKASLQNVTTKVLPVLGTETIVADSHLRGLQGLSSCYLLEHDGNAAAIESYPNVVDGVVLIVDIINMDEFETVTCERVMDIIKEKIRSMHAKTKKGSGKYRSKDKLFLSVGVVGLRDSVCSSILDLWSTMTVGQVSNSVKSVMSGASFRRPTQMLKRKSDWDNTIFKRVNLSVVPLSNYSDTMTTYSDSFFEWLSSSYSLLEGRLTSEIRKNTRQVMMWQANGVRIRQRYRSGESSGKLSRGLLSKTKLTSK
jgi:hypothetical protein